jgi:hypothetical protein
MNKQKNIELKAELLSEGLWVTDKALSGIGTQYKEQNHGLFGWDFEDHVGIALPDDFVLQDGTIVQLRMNTRSSYWIDATGNGLVLLKGRRKIGPVEWLPRPAFYKRKTKSGREMVKIGQIGGADCLFFCYQNFCSHFARGKQCLFCNLVSTTVTYDSVLRKKDSEEIGEVAAAAFSEGQAKHVLLTGGCFDRQKEVDVLCTILDSIRRHTGFDTIPGTILPSPARNKDDLKAYHEAGIQAIGYSMEIWDEPLYRAICPGKSDSVSHDEFIDSIKTAIDIFGAGNVYAVFVMGLEPKKTFLEGVKAVTSIGANVVPFAWSPNPGSMLEGHRAPSSQWFLETILEAAEIVYDTAIPAGTENHCYRCDGNSLLHDALRLKGVE